MIFPSAEANYANWEAASGTFWRSQQGKLGFQSASQNQSLNSR